MDEQKSFQQMLFLWGLAAIALLILIGGLLVFVSVPAFAEARHAVAAYWSSSQGCWIGLAVILGVLLALPRMWKAYKEITSHRAQVGLTLATRKLIEESATRGFNTKVSNSVTGDVVEVVNPLSLLAASRTVQSSVPQIEPPAQHNELPAGEGIPSVVPYASVEEQIPDGLSLLGIYPHNGDLEIVEPERYKTTWFIGGSDTGKTNTVFGKVQDMARWDAGLLICDNHAYKRDSLANKLSAFHSQLLAPVAQTDREMMNTMLAFLREFRGRRDNNWSCEKKWLIVIDEVNAIATHVVKLTDAEGKMLFEEFGIKVKGGVVKLQVFLQLLAETCGYEARGFEMFGYFISQKAAGLAWLRNAMMTVFVHAMLMESEALLAANNNRENARQVMAFKKGRTLVYGYSFEPVILQQPLYEIPQAEIVESFSRPQQEKRMEDLQPKPATMPSHFAQRPSLHLVEVDTEGEHEAVYEAAPKGSRSGNLPVLLSEQEKRIGHMFFGLDGRDPMSPNAIAKELWPDVKGGDAYQKNALLVAEAIRRFASSMQAIREA